MLWRRYSNRDFRTRAKARAVYKALCQALVAALALVLLAAPARAIVFVADSTCVQNCGTPLAAPVAPLTANKPFLAQCATALLGAAGACAPVIQQINSGAQSISDAIKPYTDNSHVAQMESFILLALAVTAAVGVVLGIARHKAQASR